MLKKIIPLVILVLGLAASARALDIDDVPNPLTRVKAGQWVKYRLMGEIEQKQTVVSVTPSGDDVQFVVKYETEDPNYDIPEMEEGYSVNAMIEAFKEGFREGNGKLSTAKITAGGREFDAIVVEITDEDGDMVKSYLSNLVPITGLILLEDDDEEDRTPILEIIDFGE